jgi:parallel beta-helix repeat protein
MKDRGFVTPVLAGVAVVALASAAPAATIYVDDVSCPDPGNGSPGNPYCAIQTAIDNAVDTDEILVAPGTYFETIDLLGKAVWLHSSDGPGVTIIDAQLMGTVVTCATGEGAGTVLEGFTITGGRSTFGGGMRNDGSSPTVTGCTFTGNTALNTGGGMYNVNNSSPTVAKCRFTGNTAPEGGGMHNTASSPTVIGCLFIDNTASNTGGGMYSYINTTPSVTNCAFIRNTAVSSDGGGMYNFSNSPTVANCLFTGNSAAAGGAMANVFSSPTVANCILWADTPDEIVSTLGAPVITYCNIQGGLAGTGNIDADPIFVDSAHDDFHLMPGSPCIDAADNAAVPGGITTDIDGNARFVDDPGTVDTGSGTPPLVDQGPYEFQGSSACRPDCASPPDGVVSVTDLLAMLSQWGGSGSCDCALPADGLVNVVDFLNMLSFWGACP